MAEQFRKNLFLDYSKAGVVADPEVLPLGTDLDESVMTAAMLVTDPFNPNVTERFYTQKDCNNDQDVDQRLTERLQEGPLNPVATAHQLAWCAAHNLGNAVKTATAVVNGNSEHLITRSKSPKLPIFALLDRFENEEGAGGTFYPANVANGMTLSLQARDVLKLTLGTAGSANRQPVSSNYVDKNCVIQAPIFGEDCTHSIGGVDVTNAYETFDFSDNPNVYLDDVHRGAGIDAKAFVTGVRTYEWKMGLTVGEDHAVYGMAKNAQTVQCIHRFGATNTEHGFLTLKKVKLRLGQQRRYFIGSSSRVGREIIGTVLYDPADAETPIKWLFKLLQATKFLELA